MLKKFLIITAIIISTGACQQTSTSNEVIVFGLENVSDINKTIFITRGEPSTIVKIGEPFNIALVNNSDDVIIFPQDYNIRLFIQNEAEWIEIENNVQYSNNSEIKFVPFSEGGLENILIKPTIPPTNETSITLRIIINGTKNHTSDIVGTYLDLSLTK